MRKRQIAIIPLIFASMIMLLSSIMPHHHHGKLICFIAYTWTQFVHRKSMSPWTWLNSYRGRMRGQITIPDKYCKTTSWRVQLLSEYHSGSTIPIHTDPCRVRSLVITSRSTKRSSTHILPGTSPPDHVERHLRRQGSSYRNSLNIELLARREPDNYYLCFILNIKSLIYENNYLCYYNISDLLMGVQKPIITR